MPENASGGSSSSSSLLIRSKNPRRCQAENPLKLLSEFAGPALMLQRQFGHVDETTTQIYLKWLATAVGLAVMANGWHRFLADDEET